MRAQVTERVAPANVRWFSERRRKGKGAAAVHLAPLRCAELERLFSDRYGDILPDDDAGREDLRIMLHHLARRTGDPRQRIVGWCATWAPWLVDDDLDEMITAVLAKPLRWRADTLAARLNLTLADRARLRIRTIGAVDRTAAERREDRRERRRLAEHARRQAARGQRGQYI